MVQHRQQAPTEFGAIVVLDHYLPGVLAGGPVTTIRNLFSIKELMPETDRLLIVTLNRDICGAEYDVRTGVPQNSEAGWVVYLPVLAPRTLLKLGEQFGTRRFYLNSFFSPATIRFLLSAKRHPSRAVVALAPRGEFSPGALSIRSWKKRPYLLAFRVMGLARTVSFFHVSTAGEQRDVEFVLGRVPTMIAEDPLPPPGGVSVESPSEHLAGQRTVVFLSRIVPKKNLLGALQVVAGIDEPVHFDIYGPEEDDRYAFECKTWLKKHMPSRHIVRFMGPCPSGDVTSVFSNYRAFLFPTHGENFGHVVPEALAAGCPVVVSNATPWQNLDEYQVGAVRPLADIEGMRDAVNALLAEDDATHVRRRSACRTYAKNAAEDPGVLARNSAVFRRVLEM